MTLHPIIKNYSFRLLVKMSSETSFTSNSIDMAVLPASTPSLCIPRVFSNITDKRVAYVIREVGLGEIDHIDMVPKTADDGTRFQRVFIHFKSWNSTQSARSARERVLSGKEIKIVYDDPWFWKLSANRAVSRTPREDRPPRQQRPRPRLVNDDSSVGDRLPHSQKQHNFRERQQERSREPSPMRSPSSPMSPPPVDLDNGEEWSKVDYGAVKIPKKSKRVIKTTVDNV